MSPQHWELRWEWVADRLRACYLSSGRRPVATAGETRVGSGEQQAGRQVVSRKPEVNLRLSWPEADWSQTGMWPTDFLGDPLSPSGMLLSFGTSLLYNLCLTGLASRKRCAPAVPGGSRFGTDAHSLHCWPMYSRLLLICRFSFVSPLLFFYCLHSRNKKLFISFPVFYFLFFFIFGWTTGQSIAIQNWESKGNPKFNFIKPDLTIVTALVPKVVFPWNVKQRSKKKKKSSAAFQL